MYSLVPNKISRKRGCQRILEQTSGIKEEHKR